MQVTSRFAWWYLTDDQKRKLMVQRGTGMFGGTPGKAPYMWVQDGSTPEGAAGASKAGVEPKHFLDKAVSAVDLANIFAETIQGL